jgi:hypothetical protein
VNTASRRVENVRNTREEFELGWWEEELSLVLLEFISEMLLPVWNVHLIILSSLSVLSVGSSSVGFQN